MVDRFVMAEAIEEAYQRGEDDESMEPMVLVEESGRPVGRVEDGDYVIFYNIRGEREIQLTQSLTDEDFHKFKRERLSLNFVTMIEYEKGLNVRVAFPPIEKIKDTLPETLSKNGLTQAKIVESEKAIHMTFYLNGKSDAIWAGEERLIIPSPEGIEYFDQRPSMNISRVSQTIVERIKDGRCNCIFANFANIDVVGHIENEEAIKEAIEAVDKHTGIVVEAAKRKGVTTIITSDHGTVERWLYPDGMIDTGHTNSPVPFILVDPNIPKDSVCSLRKDGGLVDVAPTVLEILDIPKPAAMTGKSLLVNYPKDGKRRRILLLILDGWGVREEIEGNLIAQANTPIMDRLKRDHLFTTLEASGEAVGLPRGSVGNSEVGHMHIGCGRRIVSDKVRINRALMDGSFFENEALLWAMEGVKRERKSLHLLGIVSFYSSHGSIDYLLALLELAKKRCVDKVYIHCLLGRRGERRKSGAMYVARIEERTSQLGIGKVVSIIGRHWALDREQHWDRVEKAYRLLIYGDGKRIKDRRE